MSAARLRRIAAGAETPAVREWLREGIEVYMTTAVRGGTLDVALGLRGPSGSMPWWRGEQLAERDALLFSWWQQHLGDLDPPAASREIERAAKLYECQWKKRDQHRDPADLPTSYAGTQLTLLFKIRHLGKIPAAKQCCNILKNQAVERNDKALAISAEDNQVAA